MYSLMQAVSPVVVQTALETSTNAAIDQVQLMLVQTFVAIITALIGGAVTFIFARVHALLKTLGVPDEDIKAMELEKSRKAIEEFNRNALAKAMSNGANRIFDRLQDDIMNGRPIDRTGYIQEIIDYSRNGAADALDAFSQDSEHLFKMAESYYNVILQRVVLPRATEGVQKIEDQIGNVLKDTTGMQLEDGQLAEKIAAAITDMVRTGALKGVEVATNTAGNLADKVRPTKK